MPHFAIQVHDGKKLLPRLVVSAEWLHDAERAYCDHLGLNRQEISWMADPRFPGLPYWVETQETHEEHWDLDW